MPQKIQTAERVSQDELSNNFVFQRSLLAYHVVAGMVSGRLLEIGTGAGHGISIISQHVEEFITVDKNIPNPEIIEQYDNVEYIQMCVPPFSQLPSGSFDYVVSFHVIEHVKDDFEFINEVYRVLKPSGKFIMSTPNKLRSLTRNPWHIREYSISELKNLLRGKFANVSAYGIFGNKKVEKYYTKNKIAVEQITKYDFLNFQHKLPRFLLQLPYNIFNRINRRKLLDENTKLTSSITMNDYRIDTANEDCFDLFFVSEK